MDDILKTVKKKSKKLIPGSVKKSLKKATNQMKAPYRNLRAYILRKQIPLTSGSAWFVAHRGLSALAAENTVKAFKLAAEGGFSAIETDVRRTKDKKLVLMHDDTMKRMCGIDRPVGDLTLEELSQIVVTGGPSQKKSSSAAPECQLSLAEADADPDLRIPQLIDYLHICKESGMLPMIELKDKWNEDEPLPDDYLLDVIRQTANVMRDKPVIYVSFNLKSLLRMKKLLAKEHIDHADIYHLVKGINTKKLAWYKRNGIGLSFKGKVNKLPAIRKAKEAGVPLVVWVVDNPDDVRVYIREGIKWIASNGRVWEK